VKPQILPIFKSLLFHLDKEEGTQTNMDRTITRVEAKLNPKGLDYFQGLGKEFLAKGLREPGKFQGLILFPF